MGELQMPEDEHLDSLRRQHEDLSQKVENAQQNPAIDHLEITELKKQKLKLKEEIQRLSEAR